MPLFCFEHFSARVSSDPSAAMSFLGSSVRGAGSGDKRKEEDDEFFKKIINPYLISVKTQPKSITIKLEQLQIKDVEAPKKEEDVKSKLEEDEQAISKYEGVIFSCLDAHYFMTAEIKTKVDELENKNQQLCSTLGFMEERIQYIQDQLSDV